MKFEYFEKKICFLFFWLVENTGARILYQCVPRCVGLRRITLHKSVSAGDKLYTLMCECSSFMDHLQEAAYIAPALRARLCGYWSIYRVADVY
jgi:hypothetical protein